MPIYELLALILLLFSIGSLIYTHWLLVRGTNIHVSLVVLSYFGAAFLGVVCGIFIRAMHDGGDITVAATMFAVIAAHHFRLRSGVSKSKLAEKIGKDGFTDLMCESAEGQVKRVKYLISTGAQVNANDEHGSTALMYAARNNKAKVVELLLEQGANPDIQNHNGHTGRYYAEKYGHTTVIAALDNFYK